MKQWGILRLDRRFSHFPCINLTVYNGFSTILQANKTVGLDNKTHDGLYYPCMEAGRSGRGCSSAQEVKTKRLRPDIKQGFPCAPASDISVHTFKEEFHETACRRKGTAGKAVPPVPD